MTKTITTVGIFLTEDERGHLIRLCNELEVMEERAIRCEEGPESRTRAAEQAAFRKLMNLPAESAADLAYWTEGTRLIEECLAKAQRADPGDVPFPLVGDEARLWHHAQMEAYRHALEMMGRPATESKP